MKFYLLSLMILLGISAQATPLPSAPKCVRTRSSVALVSHLQYAPGKSQQMVDFVGLGDCEALEKEFTHYVGEMWTPKKCDCRGQTISRRVIVFSNAAGMKLFFYAHNSLEYIGYETIADFALLTPNDPICYPVTDENNHCWP